MPAVPMADNPLASRFPTGSDSTPAGSDAAPYRVWVDDPAPFSTSEAGRVQHSFHQHPLVQLPRLAQLAQDLWPKGQCRFMTPDATESSSLASALRLRSPDGRRVDEVFRRIEEPGTWVALYNIESDPSYKAFLAEVMAAARPLLDKAQADIFRICGYLFISAPPSVTPFHIDRENNFWLQLHGRKTITVWDHQDREVVPSEAVEKFILDASLEDVKLDDSVRGRGREFDSGPGDGVYFPSTSPHMTQSDTTWVRPGDGVAVSIGVVFYTRATLRDARVHLCNDALRRLGFSPAFPGKHPMLDAIKEPVGSILARRRKEWPDVTAFSYGLTRE